MKKFALFLCALFISVVTFAGELHTVVIKTSMHCQACTERIKKNIRFEKGVKEIKTDLKEKTVTIKFDSEKNTPEKLVAAIKKLGYEASVEK